MRRFRRFQHAWKANAEMTKNGKQKACRFSGDPSEIRTPDTLIKSQVLYRLS